MSDFLAIAAITNTLRGLLQREFNNGLGHVDVTTQPPDKARAGTNGNQVNLFLYHSTVNPHWRNMDIPWRVKGGETSPPCLPLNLYYLVTAYFGESDDGVHPADENRLLGSHRLLGQAMSVLHENLVLDTDNVNAALASYTDDLEEHPFDQVEHVRITPQPLSLDELSKLWAGFQTSYRPSATYEVAVVLIESSLASRAPLPVLTRGEEDSGVRAQANLIPPFPTLESITFLANQPAVRLGEPIQLVGHHLEAATMTVRCSNRRLDISNDIEIVAANITGTEISASIPDAPAEWPAGYYVVEAILNPGGEEEQTTNALSFALAPQIKTPDDPVNHATGKLKITCMPYIHAGQHVTLLLGDNVLEPESVETPEDDDTQPAMLNFDISGVEVGDYWVRLRVDGVDSLLVDRSKQIPIFDASQKVTII